MTTPPLVYFVGAGPGDPSLISVRGLRHLSRADVVVHDHLIQPRLLRSARSDAERIDVGAATPTPQQQQAISYLLAEKAREGKLVVRLKWGDPFVFDDGGKEALFLSQNGIAFEIVPGIPAAVGMPAYAGVPVTYPGGGDLLTFLRGHEGQGDALPDVDWTQLARTDGTLVCYAGPRQLPAIVDALLAHGRPREEPAALVYNGTLPTQTAVEGTLERIRKAAGSAQQAAILVVGGVASFRQHLKWFDTRPLFGKRILVTRSREQAGELVELLEDLGADPLEVPTIRIAPPEDLAPLDQACAEVETFDWIVLTSANGVDHFIGRLLAGPRDVRALHGVRICTIGPATADRLARHGIKVDLMPVEYRAEAVFDAIRSVEDLAGKRILLPRADIARELLAEELRRSGAEVVEVTAYRTIPVAPDEPLAQELYRRLLEKEIDVVTFTSASTVRNFVKMLGADPAEDLLGTTVVAAIGPVTAEAAQQYNIRATIVPATYTIPGLVGAIVEYFENGTDAGR